MRLPDAAAKRLQAALHLGEHPPLHHAPLDHAERILIAHGVDQPLVLVQHAFHVGEQDHLLRLKRGGNLAGDDVGIDVERFAVLADAGGRDDGDEALPLQG